MVVVFVFFIILPQQRRQKEKNFINSLKDRQSNNKSKTWKVMLNDKDDSV